MENYKSIKDSKENLELKLHYNNLVYILHVQPDFGFLMGFDDVDFCTGSILERIFLIHNMKRGNFLNNELKSKYGGQNDL